MESESTHTSAEGESPPPFELPPLDEGAVLAPGDYLIELELSGRIATSALKEGLARLGFEEAAFDVPPRAAHVPPGIVQVTGRLIHSLAIRNTPRLHWLTARRLTVDLAAPLRLTLEPFELTSEHVYEVRFLTRMLTKKGLEHYGRTSNDPVRAFVTEKLAEGGWEPIALTVLRPDVRVDDQPHASMTLWFGILRWTGPDTFVTDDEPFHFEDITPA